VLPIAALIGSTYVRSSAWLGSDVIPLGGVWKAWEGDLADGARPTLDDSGWKSIKLPGGYFEQGFQATHSWFRKTVEIPAALAGRDLYLTLGDTRTGVIRVYVNGHRIGEQGVFGQHAKEDLNQSDGWIVKPDQLLPGANLIALEAKWQLPQHAGLVDERFAVGEYAHVKSRMAAAASLERFVLGGPTFLFPFVFVLLLVLMGLERTRETRLHYVGALGIVGSSFLYSILYNGQLVGGLLVFAQRSNLLYFPIIGFVASIFEFGRSYCGRPVNRFHWGVRGLLVFFGAMGVVSYFVVGHTYLVYPWALLTTLAVLCYLSALSVFELRKGHDDFAPLFVAAMLTVSFAAIVDVVSDLGIQTFPRLVRHGLADVPILISILIVSDFLRLSQTNQLLTLSLSKSNLELSRALDAANEATRIKGEFLANVSHELRTPLNAIINLPDGLLEEFPLIGAARCPGCAEAFELEATDCVGPKTPCPSCGRTGLEASSISKYLGAPLRTRSYLSTIKACGDHLLGVVSQILDVSQLEAGKRELCFSNVDLGPLIERVCLNLVHAASASEIEVEVTTPAERLELRADPFALTQVLMNLVANAIKFSNPGGRVHIGAQRIEDECAISVRDDGIGIAPKDHQIIFEAFRQVDGSHTRRYQGNGLGLAICKKLVDLHGGTLSVESELGKGSTFRVQIPLVASEKSSPPPEVKARGLPRAKVPLVIAVVDDDASVGESVEIALKPFGCQVLRVEDPRLLQTILDERSIDVIILDVMMPHRSGIEVLRRLKGSTSTREIPVVVSSAFPANRELIEQLGARWLGKPWTRQELEGALEGHLCHERTSGSG
jgi:signal transduction histidine kinase/CheY-like chemotaxis protein